MNAIANLTASRALVTRHKGGIAIFEIDEGGCVLIRLQQDAGAWTQVCLTRHQAQELAAFLSELVSA